MGRDLPKVTQPPAGSGLEDHPRSADSSAPCGCPNPTTRGEWRPASWSMVCLNLLVPPHPPLRRPWQLLEPPCHQAKSAWGLGQDLIFPFLPLAGSACTTLSQRIATSSLTGPQDWTPSPTTPKRCLDQTGWCGGRECLGRAGVGQGAGGQQAM